MHRLRVFVSGPISTVDPARPEPAYDQIVDHIRVAVAVSATLLELGFAPYVPHMTHFFNLMAPQPYESWIELDRAYLDVCDCILRMPGKSAGGDREVAYAQGRGIPVFTSIDEVARFANEDKAYHSPARHACRTSAT